MRGFVGSIAPERPSAAIKACNRLGGAKLHKPEQSGGAEASGLERRARSGPIPTMYASRALWSTGMKGKIRHRIGNAAQSGRRTPRADFTAQPSRAQRVSAELAGQSRRPGWA